MKRNKTRITESQLRSMIQDAVYEAVNWGKIKNKFKNNFKDLSHKAGEEVKNLFNPKRFGKIIDDLTDMDKGVVDNPNFQEEANGLDESRLRGVIREAVKSVIKERSNDYEGHDLDYESIKMQAEHIIPKMRENGESIWWRGVAEKMGFRLETLNDEDLELLKDTIEEVMIDEDPYWEEDMEFENESLNRRIDRIVKESIKRNLH